jgi:hypothetical protein
MIACVNRPHLEEAGDMITDAAHMQKAVRAADREHCCCRLCWQRRSGGLVPPPLPPLRPVLRPPAMPPLLGPASCRRCFHHLGQWRRSDCLRVQPESCRLQVGEQATAALQGRQDNQCDQKRQVAFHQYSGSMHQIQLLTFTQKRGSEHLLYCRHWDRQRCWVLRDTLAAAVGVAQR